MENKPPENKMMPAAPENKNKGGRPEHGVPSEAQTRDICNLLRLGAYVETAAASAGVAKGTLLAWLKRGARGAPGDEVYERFLNAINRAAEEADLRDLSCIDKCVTGDPVYERDDSGKIETDEKGNPRISHYRVDPDWRAAAWRLSRRNPKRWGDRLRIDTGVAGIPESETIQSQLDRGKMLEKIRAIRARRNADESSDD